MTHEETFKIPIYGYKVLLAIVEDIDEYCEDLKLEIKSDKCKAIIIAIENKFILVFQKDRLHENLIVHESFHLTAQVMRLIGCSLTDESEEAYAYLQEWIYKTVRFKTIKFKQNGNTDTSEES